QIFTKHGERIPDGKLVVTVRNEYGQSFRPKSIPTALAHPYLTDTVGTYVDAIGNTVNNGDYITPPSASSASCPLGGCLVPVTAQPNLKPDHIADVPYNAYGRPVYDAQSQLLTHGAFHTNYIPIGPRRGSTNANPSFQNSKHDELPTRLKD